jgi:hypothetical protein
LGRFSLRGKPWLVEEERQLREHLSNGVSVDEIARIMGKTRLSIRGKMNNLGLTVVVAAARQHNAATTITTTSVPTIVEPNPYHTSVSSAESNNTDLFAAQIRNDGPLPSVEAKLRVLDAALVALEKPGLSMAEIARLNKIILGVKVYQELFAQFVNYRALETELVELRRQLASERGVV